VSDQISGTAHPDLFLRLDLNDEPLQMVPDDVPTRIEMGEPHEDGYRRRYIACCDCGLTHLFLVAPDGSHLYAKRAPVEVAAQIHEEARRLDPGALPLLPR
jgi:hypothetical protein